MEILQIPDDDLTNRIPTFEDFTIFFGKVSEKKLEEQKMYETMGGSGTWGLPYVLYGPNVYLRDLVIEKLKQMDTKIFELVELGPAGIPTKQLAEFRSDLNKIVAEMRFKHGFCASKEGISDYNHQINEVVHKIFNELESASGEKCILNKLAAVSITAESHLQKRKNINISYDFPPIELVDDIRRRFHVVNLVFYYEIGIFHTVIE